MVHSRTVYTALFAIAGSASSVLAVPISSSSSSSAPTGSTLAATATASGIGIAPASTSDLVVPSGSVPNSRRSEAVDVLVDDVNKCGNGEEDEEIEDEDKLDLALITVPTHEEDHVMNVMTPHPGLDGSSIESGKEDVTLGINIGARTPIEEDKEPLIPKTSSIPGAGHNAPGAPPNPGNSSSSNNKVHLNSYAIIEYHFVILITIFTLTTWAWVTVSILYVYAH
ncbi:hypothetical protein F5876DRAFT_69935 [Lentinula aff. lateritia]|uniref:Uncharacterized protein n=1 Tax=Lentinula aff. lateritia TaxID=2804960 RepID=A0ACC1TKP5_9AGAR|nr:hypothetical protein F5876DRAFT_69935 [Lentinula aff. lateritia]